MASQASSLLTEIKQKLEEKHGPLKKVCVAAAGRALKTERSKVTIDINGKPLIKNQDILHLELSAVQQAQSFVAEKHESEQSFYYYCVGYSVLYYRLDGEEIGNLIDQQGKEASVEIIATFLPKVVVESLLSALHRAGLEMHHGDGVQWSFYDDPNVCTLSIHETGRYLFPGTGNVNERGQGNGYGYSFNIPLDAFTEDESWLDVYRTSIREVEQSFLTSQYT